METTLKEIKTIQTIMKLTYGIVPIVAGADKFTNLLTDWTAYISPTHAAMLPFSPHVFMMIVGVIEILAGVIVLVKTEAGSLIVSLWLVLIALSLIISCRYLDVAVRDLVMAIGAYMLFRLTMLLKKEGGL